MTFDDNHQPIQQEQQEQNYKPIVYTQQELDAMRQVQEKLKEEYNLQNANLKSLALTTIISKLRVDEAVKKYIKLVEALAIVDMTPDWNEKDLWMTKGINEQITKSYEPAGVDHDGQCIMWVRSKSVVYPQDQLAYVQAGLLYWMAVHADDKSLHKGVSFVFDLTNKPSEKTGTEKDMQKVHQSYPARPKAISLAGASFSTRLAVNVVIKIASVFTKIKILDRIKFMTVDEAVNLIPFESVPKYLGGNGGGIDDILNWTKDRVDSIPEPIL